MRGTNPTWMAGDGEDTPRTRAHCYAGRPTVAQFLARPGGVTTGALSFPYSPLLLPSQEATLEPRSLNPLTK